jgi:hypothetical protein
MSTSSRKVAANRRNGQKSRGPNNTTSTRFNAAKHGLLAVGITDLDDGEGHQTILNDVMREKNPVGIIEMHLVKAVALDMVRWTRAMRLKAEFITGELNPEILWGNPLSLNLSQPIVLEPGLPPAITFESAQRLVSAFQRYETAITHRLFRSLHELERLQRMRRGENLPAPATVDVNIHADTRIADSVPSVLEQPQPLPDEQDCDLDFRGRPAQSRSVFSVGCG